MTVPPPYGPPPPPYVAPPRKKRPSAWWFLPGAVAIALAVVGIIIAVVTGVRLFRTDGYLVADGHAHTIALDSGDHMLFIEVGLDNAPSCTAHGATEPVTLTKVDSDSTLGVNDLDWVPFAKFSTADQAVGITCNGVDERVRIGAPVDGSRIVTIAVSVIAAVGLGVAGLAALVVTAVFWFTREPRNVSA